MLIVSIESLMTGDSINWVMVMDNGSLDYESVVFTQAVVSCVPAWIVALLELDVAELTTLLFGEFVQTLT